VELHLCCKEREDATACAHVRDNFAFEIAGVACHGPVVCASAGCILHAAHEMHVQEDSAASKSKLLSASVNHAAAQYTSQTDATAVQPQMQPRALYTAETRQSKAYSKLLPQHYKVNSSQGRTCSIFC
jgi:hypothetical protein